MLKGFGRDGSSDSGLEYSGLEYGSGSSVVEISFSIIHLRDGMVWETTTWF